VVRNATPRQVIKVWPANTWHTAVRHKAKHAPGCTQGVRHLRGGGNTPFYLPNGGVIGASPLPALLCGRAGPTTQHACTLSTAPRQSNTKSAANPYDVLLATNSIKTSFTRCAWSSNHGLIAPNMRRALSCDSQCASSMQSRAIIWAKQDYATARMCSSGHLFRLQNACL